MKDDDAEEYVKSICKNMNFFCLVLNEEITNGKTIINTFRLHMAEPVGFVLTKSFGWYGVYLKLYAKNVIPLK